MSAPTGTRPQQGEEIELSVDALAYGGNGVARTEGGYVVFVRDAIPGDRVRAKITKRKRAYAEARTLEVLAAGPDRIDPVALHPGAPWQVLPYERQLEIKHEQVVDALRRIGHLEDVDVRPIVPAVEQWRYRNKLEYSFGTGPGGTLVCGFHAPGSWHDIVQVDDCMLASERGNAAREQVLAWCRAEGLDAMDRRTHEGVLRNLVVREGRRTGQLQVRLVTANAELELSGLAEAVDCEGLLWTRTDDLGETTQGGKTEIVAGHPNLQEELCSLDFSISPNAFFQTNTEMAEVLYGLAAEYAALRGYERVYDLFCGIGTVGLSLAAQVGEIWGLEIVEEAVADAIANAQRNGIRNAQFFAGDVRIALRELVEKAQRPDVLIVDPPRAGLSQKVVRRIIEAAPKRVVYVSCNPTTLAPNAAQLVEAGFAMGSVTPVDMFPQTPHIECVTAFERV